MTDEKNQHQRHLAKMLLAQCDKKILQYYQGGVWVTMPCPLFEYPHLSRMRVRIKPEPREWWICEKCQTSLDERFAAHHSRDGKTFCEGKQADLRKSREVLEP